MEEIDFNKVISIVNAAPPPNIRTWSNNHSDALERYITTSSLVNHSEFRLCYFSSFKGYNDKPDWNIDKGLSRELSTRRCCTTIENFARAIYSGHTVGMAVRSDGCKRRGLVYFVGYDFDDYPTTMKETINLAKIKPTVAYETFSNNTHKNNRFRFLYVLANPMLISDTDFPTIYKKIAAACGLRGYDHNCIDITRAFNGTNSQPVCYSTMLVWDGSEWWARGSSTDGKKIELEKTKKGEYIKFNPQPRWILKYHGLTPRQRAVKDLNEAGVSEKSAELLLKGVCNFLNEYTPKETLSSFCGYDERDGYFELSDQNNSYSLDRIYKPRWHNGKFVKYKDGERRHDVITLAAKLWRKCNMSACADDILYYTIRTWFDICDTQISNEDDGHRMDGYAFAHLICCVMESDLTDLEPDRNPSFTRTDTATLPKNARKHFARKFAWINEDEAIIKIAEGAKSVQEIQYRLECSERFSDRKITAARIEKVTGMKTETETQRNRRILQENVDKKKKRAWNWMKVQEAGFTGSESTFVKYWKSI